METPDWCVALIRKLCNAFCEPDEAEQLLKIFVYLSQEYEIRGGFVGPWEMAYMIIGDGNEDNPEVRLATLKDYAPRMAQRRKRSDRDKMLKELFFHMKPNPRDNLDVTELTTFGTMGFDNIWRVLDDQWRLRIHTTLAQCVADISTLAIAEPKKESMFEKYTKNLPPLGDRVRSFWHKYMPSSDLDAAYHILQVPRSATDEQVTNAFKARRLERHPDRPTGSHEKFVELQEAVKLIKETRFREDHV